MTTALAIRVPKDNGKRDFEETIRIQEADSFALSHEQRSIAIKGLKLLILDQVDKKAVTAVVDCIAEQNQKDRFNICFTDVKRKHYIDVKFPKGYDAHRGCTIIDWDDYFLFG